MLDSILVNEKRVDLIKIDVQGHEYEVLTGAKDVLTSFKPLVLIEIDNRKSSFEAARIWKLLTSYGYEFYDFANLRKIEEELQLLARNGYFDVLCRVQS
jgi:Methyltransferase FkbM domain